MHTRDFFYDNYKNHPEPVLKRIAGEYSKLTPEAQQALRDVLAEKGYDELLAGIQSVEQKKENLSKLNAEEVRRLVNKRLANGESIDLIKVDLQDKGVNIYQFGIEETKAEEKIEERMVSLQKDGKSAEEIQQAIRKEFRLTEEAAKAVPEKMQSAGAGFIIIGGVLLLISVPLAAVILQSDAHYSKQFLFAVPAGIALLIFGLRKRRAAQKLLAQQEK